MNAVDNRAIGVFDSGLGGLTAVRELKKILPNEKIIYLGDTGRVPYGTRSKATLLKYTRQDIEFLLKQDVKAIVVACGTVSSVVLDDVKSDYNLDVIGVIDPTVNSAISGEVGQKIGVIGTSATIKSGSYERKISEISAEKNLCIETFAVDCPLFVPLVENGRTAVDDKVLRLVVEEYLSFFKGKNIDTLILGCTHYPLLADAISDFLGDDVKLVNPGFETAKIIAKTIEKADDNQASQQYFVTDDVESFTKNAKTFLGEEIKQTTNLIDLG